MIKPAPMRMTGNAESIKNFVKPLFDWLLTGVPMQVTHCPSRQHLGQAAFPHCWHRKSAVASLQISQVLPGK